MSNPYLAKPTVLTPEDGVNDLDGVTHLTVGLSWDKSSAGKGGLLGKLKRAVGTDLDLIAVLLNANGKAVRYAGFDVTDALGDGSVVHTGDNQSGKGDGDDEAVIIDFAKVPPNVHAVVYLAGAFKEHSSLNDASKISVKVYDGTGGQDTQVADIWPELTGTGNMMAIAKVSRRNTVGPDAQRWGLEVIDKRQTVSQGDLNGLFLAAQRL